MLSNLIPQMLMHITTGEGLLSVLPYQTTVTDQAHSGLCRGISFDKLGQFDQVSVRPTTYAPCS